MEQMTDVKNERARPTRPARRCTDPISRSLSTPPVVGELIRDDSARMDGVHSTTWTSRCRSRLRAGSPGHPVVAGKVGNRALATTWQTTRTARYHVVPTSDEIPIELRGTHTRIPSTRHGMRKTQWNCRSGVRGHHAPAVAAWRRRLSPGRPDLVQGPWRAAARCGIRVQILHNRGGNRPNGPFAFMGIH